MRLRWRWSLTGFCVSWVVSSEHIAVLTPYVGQLDALRSGMQQRGLRPLTSPIVEPTSSFPLEQCIVFREASGILFSFFGVSEQRSLHFQNQRVNLLNVAVSRARQHFITVGDIDIPERALYQSSGESFGTCGKEVLRHS